MNQYYKNQLEKLVGEENTEKIILLGELGIPIFFKYRKRNPKAEKVFNILNATGIKFYKYSIVKANTIEIL